MGAGTELTRIQALLAEAARLRPVNRRPQPRQGGSWYRIDNHAADTAEILVYDEIGYGGVAAQQFAEDLRSVTAPSIKVRINSPGGDVFDGLAIYNSLRSHPAQVTTYVEGLAASAASFIAQAGDRVICARNAMVMVHDAAGLCIGNAADMRELAGLLDQVSDNIADIYAQRAGGTVADWRERMLAETWYTGAEAVEAGLADEVDGADDEATPEPAGPEALMARSWDLTIFTYAGRDAAPAPSPRAAAETATLAGVGAPVDAAGAAVPVPEVDAPAADPPAGASTVPDGQYVVATIRQPDADAGGHLGVEWDVIRSTVGPQGGSLSTPEVETTDPANLDTPQADEPDVWAALVERLTDPALAVDAALARLRGDAL